MTLVSVPAVNLDLPVEPAIEAPRPTAAVQAQVLQLFDACAPSLRRYARSFGLPPDAAEDVVQEAFLALFRHLLVGGADSNLRGWLVRVSCRLALKQRAALARRRACEVTLHDLTRHTVPPTAAWLDPVDPAASPESMVVLDQHRQRVRAVVQALPERDRQCVWMRADGVTYRDIAATLGISLGSVAKSLTRAAVRLARAVKE